MQTICVTKWVHFLKTEGKVAFMFRMLVAIDGVGLLYEFVVILNLGGSSTPSTGRTRVSSFLGFSMYSGNFAIVLFQPFLAGFAGLNARSCSHLVGAVIFLGCGLISSLTSNTTLFSLKSPPRSLLVIWEKGLSCSFDSCSNLSLVASFFPAK